jgi:hypothetical protein
MSNSHNSESPELVQAKIEEHKQLVPVYLKEPEKSLIDSAIVKWGSKILLGIMSLVVLPVVLHLGGKAYDNLQNHGEVLAVVINNQKEEKDLIADLDKKIDTVVSEVNAHSNQITALNTEVADMKANQPIVPTRVIEPPPEPVWRAASHRQADNTPPLVKAI